MKVLFFHLMPYVELDLDYDKKYESPWLTLPNSYYDPKKGAKLYHRYLDEMELASELGFDGVCVNEHHQTAYGLMPAPNILAGALSRRIAQDCKICVLGRALPIVSNPLQIAEEFAILDNILEGRLITGFVRGIGSEYFTTMANPGESHARFHEAHDLIVEAWTKTGPFQFYGKYYRFDYVNIWPRPYQDPHPPIWIPSQGSTETIKFAAHPDHRYTYLQTFSPWSAVSRFLLGYRDQCEEYGYECEDRQIGWATPVYVAETDEQARREVAPHFENFFNKFLTSPIEYKVPPGYNSIQSMKTVFESKYKMRSRKLSFDDLVENGMVTVGSPQTVIDIISERHQQIGFGNMVMLAQLGTLPADLTEKNLRMIASEVFPHIKKLGETSASAKAAAAGE